MNGKPQLGTKQAADFLGVTTKTLAVWRQKGYGPSFYQLPNKMIFYARSDIENWIERHRVETTA